MTDDNVAAWNEKFHIELARLNGRAWAHTKAKPDDLRKLAERWRSPALDALAFAIDAGSLNAEQLAKQINPAYTAAIFDTTVGLSESEGTDSIQGIDTAFRGVDAAYLRAFCTGAIDFWDEIKRAARPPA
jgi:hypothetical protein